MRPFANFRIIRTYIFSILATVLFGAAARADLIIGDPDNSWIRYELAGSIPSEPFDPLPVVQDYSSPVVTTEINRTGASGGALSWKVHAAPAQGVLRALVSASMGPSGNADQAVLAVYLQDRVFVDQVLTEPTTFTVRLAVDGSVTGATPITTQVVSHLRSYTDPFGDGLVFDEFNSQEMGAFDFLLEDEVTLQPGQQWFDIDALLHLNVWSATTADFLNTAFLEIVAPSGITFRSEAGFTGSTITVPEPATVALFGAGLVGIGLLSRRRKA